LTALKNRIIKDNKFTYTLAGKKMTSQSLILEKLGYFQGRQGWGDVIRRVAG